MTTEKVGSYIIVPPKKLILEYYSGEIRMSDLIQFKRIISKDPNYNFYFNTIIDFRDAELLINNDEFVRLLEFFRKKFRVTGMRNVAYLTSTPNAVVITTLFSLLADEYADLNFNLKTFSTIEAASNWFSAAYVTSETLGSLIFELKTKPNNVYKK
jgi:hypothetical protein